MFDNLTHSQWVAIAWLELVVAYAGYLIYLNWLERRAKRVEEDRQR